jgi:hypothetical protein
MVEVKVKVKVAGPGIWLRDMVRIGRLLAQLLP